MKSKWYFCPKCRFMFSNLDKSSIHPVCGTQGKAPGGPVSLLQTPLDKKVGVGYQAAPKIVCTPLSEIPGVRALRNTLKKATSILKSYKDSLDQAAEEIEAKVEEVKAKNG